MDRLAKKQLMLDRQNGVNLPVSEQVTSEEPTESTDGDTSEEGSTVEDPSGAAPEGDDEGSDPEDVTASLLAK